MKRWNSITFFHFSVFLPPQRFHATLQLSMWFNHMHTHTPLKFCCFSVAKPCLTLCNSMDCSISGFPALTVSQSLLRFVSIELVMLSFSSSVTGFSSCPQSFSASGSFPTSQFFASGGQSIRASASASVLPMSIQGWFPLVLTGLISLQFKVLSRVFSTPRFKSINSSALSLLYGPTLTPIHDYWKKP